MQSTVSHIFHRVGTDSWWYWHLQYVHEVPTMVAKPILIAKIEMPTTSFCKLQMGNLLTAFWRISSPPLPLRPPTRAVCPEELVTVGARSNLAVFSCFFHLKQRICPKHIPLPLCIHHLSWGKALNKCASHTGEQMCFLFHCISKNYQKLKLCKIRARFLIHRLMIFSSWNMSNQTTAKAHLHHHLLELWRLRLASRLLRHLLRCACWCVRNILSMSNLNGPARLIASKSWAPIMMVLGSWGSKFQQTRKIPCNRLFEFSFGFGTAG